MIVDRTNMYSMIDYWMQDIAPKYLDMTDLSLSNVGLFGYMNEVMGHAFESTTNESSVFYNELFYKKARLPESIYTYAAQTGIDDINAIPPKMQFALGIREDIMLENLITVGSDSYFIIDKDTDIVVENQVNYMMDYDIKISVRNRNGKYIYSAMYIYDDTSDNKIINPLSEINGSTNPFLKVTTIKQNGYNYIYVFIKARQVTKTIVTRNVYKEEFIDFYTFDIDYVGSLADFYVLYKAPNSNKYIQLDKIATDSAPSGKPFCYYAYRDDDTISVSFSTMARYFRPEFNSELKFVIFTTMGESGIFSYTGDNVRVIPKSDKYDYRSIIMHAQSLSDSYDGRDRLTYDEIKEKTSYLASTNNSIGTTIDLNKYFQNIKSESKFMFVKKRDDILDRLFGAYVLLYDKNKNIIPSNTLNFKLDDTVYDSYEENTKRGIIKAGNKFVYDNNERRVVLDRNADPNTKDFVYTNPFTFVISKSPYAFSYYLNSINKTFLTDFYYINDLALCNFITNNISITRDAINGDDKYNMSFSLLPNSTIDIPLANVDSSGVFVSPTDSLVVKGVIFDDNDEISHYFDFNMTDFTSSNKSMKFEGSIKTDDYISVQSALRTVDSVYKNRSTVLEHDLLIPGTNIKMGLCIFLKDTNPISHKIHANIPNMDDYTVSNIYKFGEVSLINNMTDIMRSTLMVKPVDETAIDPTDFYYIIKEVPFVRYQYLTNRYYSLDFINLVGNIGDTLRSHLERLINNFSVDYKFYNTYGKSYYLYTDNDVRHKLDKVNIKLSLDIRLNPNRNLDEALKTDILNHIKLFVENSNDSGNLYISTLIATLKSTFREITFIEFKSINDYNALTQTIQQDFPSQVKIGSKIIDFVPEYINLDKVYDGQSVHDKIMVNFS